MGRGGNRGVAPNRTVLHHFQDKGGIGYGLLSPIGETMREAQSVEPSNTFV